MNPELDAVDDDIREWYAANYDRAYIAGVPIKIQIVRLLRRLLDQGDDSKNGARDGERSKHDVEPKKPIGQHCSCSFVMVDGIGNLLCDSGNQCALNLFVELRSDLSMIAKGLHDFTDGHINIPAGLRFGHGMNIESNVLTSSANVVVMATPLAGASVERGVEVIVM